MQPPRNALHQSSQRDITEQTRGHVLLMAWLASGYWVARYYQNKLAEHGASPYALAERADEKVSTFYDNLFESITFPQPLTVLDIGCGLGDLIPYLQQRGFTISDYLGLDLVDGFIRNCQQRYGPPFEFRRQNFVSPSFRPQQKFGVVVNVGCMVSRVIGYESYVAYCCTKMMQMASHAVLFNMITEVQPTSQNYRDSNQIGHITPLAKSRLLPILDRVTRQMGWTYTLHDEQIYHDATDTFVALHAPQTDSPD